MKKYWKNAWNMYRRCNGLTKCPAWNAINLTAVEGTSWSDARLIFNALLIASGKDEPWQRTADQVEDI